MCVFGHKRQMITSFNIVDFGDICYPLLANTPPSNDGNAFSMAIYYEIFWPYAEFKNDGI